MSSKTLRVVPPDEEPTKRPLSLLEAVESGDILAIMKAQRRIIAESLTAAGDNTRPQYSNELNKLNKLIAEEELKRSVEDADSSVVAGTPDEAFDPELI